jgi:hypothetical protein
MFAKPRSFGQTKCTVQFSRGTVLPVGGIFAQAFLGNLHKFPSLSAQHCGDALGVVGLPHPVALLAVSISGLREARGGPHLSLGHAQGGSSLGDDARERTVQRLLLPVHTQLHPMRRRSRLANARLLKILQILSQQTLRYPESGY